MRSIIKSCGDYILHLAEYTVSLSIVWKIAKRRMYFLQGPMEIRQISEWVAIVFCFRARLLLIHKLFTV